jgi:hypothetical protein
MADSTPARSGIGQNKCLMIPIAAPEGLECRTGLIYNAFYEWPSGSRPGDDPTKMKIGRVEMEGITLRA